VPPPQHPPHRRTGVALLSVAAALLLLLVWSQLAAVALRLPPAAAIAWLLAVTGSFLLIHSRPWRWNRRLRARSRLRWPSPGPGWTAALAPGVFALVASLSVFLLAAGLARPDEYPEELHRFLERPWGGVAFVVLVVVTAPIIEEVAFRGWIQGTLERRLPAGAAVAIAAVLFAAMHVTSTLLPARIAAGLVLGHAVLLTRSVWTGVFLHASWNAGMVAAAALAPGWDPSGAGWATAGPALLGATVAAAWCLAALRGLERSSDRDR
jgi:uncharacterized protein